VALSLRTLRLNGASLALRLTGQPATVASHLEYILFLQASLCKQNFFFEPHVCPADINAAIQSTM
jgi:hypothetical protein